MGELTPAVSAGGADAGAHDRGVLLERLAQAAGHLPDDQHGPPSQPRRQLDQALARQPCAGPGQLLGVLQQAERAFGKRLVAAGQANERPGIARTQWPPGVPTGHQPSLDTRPLDAHGSRPIAIGR